MYEVKMSYTVEELKPANPAIILNKEGIELSLLDLNAEVLLIEKYGSLSVAVDSIAKDSTNLIQIVWILVSNKLRFNGSFEEFASFVLSSNESIADKAKTMKRGLDEAIVKSMPLIKNKKRYDEIQKIKNSQTDSKPCYAGYFDSLSKRYGMTLDEFYKLTLRQIHILLKTADEKSYEDLEVTAALNGMKLKPRINMDETVTPEEEKENQEQAMEALKRLQAEYEAKNGK
jgi:hypothetical protein